MAGYKSSLLLALVMIAGISELCSAATHIVGGTTGWTIPSSPSTYSTWANGETFAVGDVLVFNFTTGAHTVAEVSKANYDVCSTNRTIGAVRSTGPASITLTAAGTHYFLCTIPNHCSTGQKLAVTVTGPTGSPASSPAPAGGASAPSGGAATPAEGPTTPSGTPTVPAAGSPAADGPGSSSPPGNFAASTSVSMLSLVSVGVAALMF
ncbi:cucumber peeling cupredoxin-like [Chenopodium quinoa]|uniref:cucumber peeling cupredoxin-like n=1 Tax=Chenopodium quinoa TaxID=63459 RepID=UPI000B78B67E|nr:cucumber peeling cupredoxin-like [Chenopodium quinoa]